MAANPVPIPSSPLTIEVAQLADAAHVSCSGRLTSDTTDQLKARVKPLLSEAKTVRIDLASVSYMDSSGLGALVGLYVSAKSAHCELRLVHLSDRVRDLLRMSNLLTIFEGYGEFL